MVFNIFRINIENCFNIDEQIIGFSDRKIFICSILIEIFIFKNIYLSVLIGTYNFRKLHYRTYIFRKTIHVLNYELI